MKFCNIFYGIYNIVKPCRLNEVIKLGNKIGIFFTKLQQQSSKVSHFLRNKAVLFFSILLYLQTNWGSWLEVLALTQIHQIRNYFPQKNHVLLSNFFSSSNMLFIRLFLANTWEKNRGSPCLFPQKLLWKVDMVLRSQSGWIICAAGTGARDKITPIVFEVRTRDQACFRLFLRVWYRQHRNSNLKRLH